MCLRELRRSHSKRRVGLRMVAMSSHFHVDAGPFAVDLQVDGSGIRFQQGMRNYMIAWENVTGATYVQPDAASEATDARQLEQARQFLGAETLEKLLPLRGRVGRIVVAYRDARNHLEKIVVPAPMDDSSIAREFEQRLGPRWLGESRDEEHAAKRLHTNPGFFKSAFILLALFGVLGMIAVMVLLGLAGPLLNLFSIQKMLLALQDGNYADFAYRLGTYLALLIIGYLLHRVLRSWRDTRKRGYRAPSGR